MCYAKNGCQQNKQNNTLEMSISKLSKQYTTDQQLALLANQIKSNQDLFIVGITYNDISLYNIIHLNNQ